MGLFMRVCLVRGSGLEREGMGEVPEEGCWNIGCGDDGVRGRGYWLWLYEVGIGSREVNCHCRPMWCESFIHWLAVRY